MSKKLKEQYKNQFKNEVAKPVQQKPVKISAFEIVGKYVGKWYSILAISIILFTIYFAKYSVNESYHDYCNFGGDAWEYQSMAVNFAKGHGVQKFGGIENFSVYKFNNNTEGSAEYFTKNAGTDNFYRTPGYSVFLGLVYKVFGVSPLAAKKTQLVILLLISVSLPALGYYLWKTPGLVCGIIASYFHADGYYDISMQILTESLIMFWAFLITLLFLLFEKKSNFITAILLGISIGIGFLIKGSFLFLPLLIVCFLIYRYFKTKEKKQIANLILVTGFTLACIVPWSVYATKQSGKPIFISTQGDQILLDGNNEFATGAWANQWAKDSTSFYNNDKMEDKSAAIRVLNFYAHYPEKLPVLISQKIVRGFIPFYSLWVLVALFFTENIGLFVRKYFPKKRIDAIVQLLVGAITLGLVSLGSTFKYAAIYNGFVNHSFLFLFIVILLLVFYFINKEKLLIELPMSFKILFLNFFFIITAFFADGSENSSRFVYVICFLFTLTSLYYFYALTSDIYKRIKTTDK